ncbi:MAG TPA: cytochrome c [Anaerolineae bacterium]|nr:cytochrome c [Anaerolineae bacterium]
MAGEGRLKPFEASDYFPDGQSARTIVSGTLPLGSYPPGDPVASGRADGDLLDEVPIALDDQVLGWGRERFNIYCAPCHGPSGMGDGTVAQHGFPQPPSLLSDALRQVPVGYLFVVITEGRGAMPDYDGQIPPLDRWAIAAAVRSIQEAGASQPQATPEGQP